MKTPIILSRKLWPLVFALTIGHSVWAQTSTETLIQGNYSDPSIWTNSTPNDNSTALIAHNLILDRNITINQGHFSFNESSTGLNTNQIDLALTGSATQKGIAEVFSNVRISGNCHIQNHGKMIISSGDTMEVNNLILFNGSELIVEDNALLLVNGNAINRNNSTNITVNGNMKVKGNYIGGNNSALMGSGTLETDGFIFTWGTGTVFSRTTDCFTPPCVMHPYNPLPVQLVSFDALNVQDLVALKWETESEVRNDYFTVERSVDGKEIEQISVIKGAGFSNIPITYEAFDPDPHQGMQYYRITQTDWDGETVHYSWVPHYFEKQISEAGSPEMFIYPNPNEGESIQVSFSGFRDNEEIFVQVIDHVGKPVIAKLQVISEGDFMVKTFDLNDKLDPGVYTIIAHTDTYHRLTGKLVITQP